MITCTRRLTFCAGHRVNGHENKCAHMHGHNYTLEVTAEAAALDAVGRVIDFSVLKRVLGTWLDTNFDHGFILHAKDVSYVKMLQGISVSRGGGKPEPQKLFLLPTNPTAENIAAYLGEVVCPRLFFDHNVKVTRIRLHETENCYADWVA